MKEQSSYAWVIIGVFVVAVVLSSMRTEEPSGMIIRQSGCPDDKKITKTIVDSSTSGNWQDFHFSNSAQSAAEECTNYGATAGNAACDEYCNPCEGTFRESPDSGEITGYVMGSNGDYYSLPLSPDDWKKILNAGSVAAECKIKGDCRCSDKKTNEQQVQLSTVTSSQATAGNNQQTVFSPPRKNVFVWFFGLFRRK